MLYSVLYARFMEASSVLYSRFLPSTTATNIYLHPDYFSLLILCLNGLFYLDMLHTLWMHASSEQFLVKLNYVERGLSRLCGGHGELPCEVLWRNLMELCELRRSRFCILHRGKAMLQSNLRLCLTCHWYAHRKYYLQQTTLFQIRGLQRRHTPRTFRRTACRLN